MGDKEKGPVVERLEDRMLMSGEPILTIDVPECVTRGTEYPLIILGDNKELIPDGTATTAVQWRVYNPCFSGTIDFILGVSVYDNKLPTENDFFAGKRMLPGFNNVKLPASTIPANIVPSGRIVDAGESGVSNGAGRLGEYMFNINGYDGEFGVKGYFPYDSVKFSKSGVEQKPKIVISEEFTIVPYIPGDINMNNTVNYADYVDFKRKFGDSTAGKPLGEAWGKGDFNLDGIVDGIDLRLLQENIGKSRSDEFNPSPGSLNVLLGVPASSQNSTNNIPEPTSIAVLSALALAGLAYNKRRKTR